MNTNHQALQPHGATHRHLSVNITPSERGGRIVLGAATFIAALILLTSAGSGIAVFLEVLLALAGLDLVVTGALGHCPLYQKLGYTPRSLRNQS
ncbi:MAG: DUF2892 domain-containing protein [Actinobacteria bacterium]|nr:DUF2892 domain-containing protein [Actinomycetota bacterium]